MTTSLQDEGEQKDGKLRRDKKTEGEEQKPCHHYHTKPERVEYDEWELHHH
jgi:hypothetical protein